jgi:hypothetical protein
VSEKEPGKKETAEQVLQKLGRSAVRLEQIKRNEASQEIAPGVIQQDNGNVHFWSGHKYIDAHGIRPLTRGLMNPNNN